jgi:hypothetical protein
MTDKKKGKHTTAKPTKIRKDELTEKDLDKASGGGGNNLKVDF